MSAIIPNHCQAQRATAAAGMVTRAGHRWGFLPYQVVVALLLALLARAIYTKAASFLLPCAAGIAYFAWCSIGDLLGNWPAFREEMQ
ncbi:hypothetical protein [Stenotrophomonas sp.]|uniref:hypothetical protein n=1 Tax=Stenotrophomonas sp. TaxID=69392 RepID=UPI00333F8D57